MKNKVIYFILTFMLLPLFLKAQCELPERAMGMPKIFLNEEMSWNWDNVVRGRKWGESSGNYWKVYVDRNGVMSYKSPSSSSGIKEKSLAFMESYYVAKVQDGYALLYKEKYEQTGLVISKQARSIGWVSVDELLLWSTCPRTRGQVYQKAVIAKDIEEIQNKSDINESSPEFSKSPIRMIGSGHRATDLEFYFVYKKVNGSALLFKDNKITDSNTDKMPGWMRRGLYVPWNERLCYEPNYGSEYIGKVAAIYRDSIKALQYKQGQNPGGKLWEEKLKNNRWIPNKVRFPVLTIGDKYIAKVATIGSFGTPGNSGNDKDLDSINDKIQKLEKKMKRINVVFVIDGTSSMNAYYKPMAMALINSMKRIEVKGADMKFGALVYRNYADKERLCEYKQLTRNHDEVADWLIKKGSDCSSVGKGHFEALFCGLDSAVTTMDWQKEESNFLILVGDAANDTSDARGFSEEKIARTMAEKEINFVAFQANHQNTTAYHKFSRQIKEIMTKELSSLMNRSVTIINDFKQQGQLEKFETNNGHIPIMSAAYRFAEINKTEYTIDLQNLVESMIVDFKKQSDKSIDRFRIALENLGSQTEGVEFNETNIINILRDAGLNDKDIEIYKEKNLALKVTGHTSRVADETEVFTTSVFMTKKELEDLIRSLVKVTENVTTNPRQHLQNALKNLALSYLGQNDATRDDITVDEVMKAVSTLTPTTGKKLLQGVNVKDITDPNRVTDSEINDFISTISHDVSILNKRKEDKTCYFERDGLRYYYILLEDMPLQEH